MVIYKITNLINGKIYIGQTTRSVKERWKSHCNRKDSKSAITSAILKYRKENFTLEIIEKVSIKSIDRRERYWIKKLNTIAPNGYNLEFGGNKHKKASKQLRKKLSLAKLGKKYGKRKPGSGDNISKGLGCKEFLVFTLDNKFIGKWFNRLVCAKQLKLRPEKISACLYKKRKQHKGFTFKFVEEIYG